jgi:hypothetical protein
MESGAMRRRKGSPVAARALAAGLGAAGSERTQETQGSSVELILYREPDVAFPGRQCAEARAR